MFARVDRRGRSPTTSSCHNTIGSSLSAQTRCVRRLSEIFQSGSMNRMSQLLFHLASLRARALSECALKASKEQLALDCGGFSELL
jgi:hypothetical protein